MTTELTAKVEGLLDEATKRFSAKSSALHRALAKELTSLAKHHTALAEAFDARKAKRASAAESVRVARITAARAELERVTQEQAPLLANGNPHLQLIAENLVEFSRGRIDLAETLARSDALQVEREDNIDGSLQLWIEELSVAAIESIDSDKARKRAVAIINGGLIVGGVTTLPFVPALSALFAAIILAQQWRDTASEEGADSDANRVESATRLLAHVNTIMQAWQQVL